MPDPVADRAEAVQPPTFEALRSAQEWVRLSPEARRLFWSLDGPLASSVHFMATESSPDSLEPCVRSEEGNTVTAWHPAAHAPLTIPYISSVTVRVDTIDEWEETWLEVHQDHADPDQADEDGSANRGEARFGELPDYDPDEDEEPPHLLKCCTTVRPRGKKTSVVVEPHSTRDGSRYVTIQDYVATVHPWLMSMHEDIRWAVNCHVDDKPRDEGKKLAVNYDAPESLMVVDQDEWMALARTRSQRQNIQVEP